MSMNKDDVKALFEEHAPNLLKRCKSLLRDKTLANDALQDIFVRVITYYDSFDQAPSKIFWLLRACDQVCINHHRKCRYQKAIEGEYYDTACEGYASPAQTADITIDMRDTILRLLQTLDKRDQDIAILHFLYQLTHQDIATKMGLSKQTVFFRLARLRNLIHKDTKVTP